MEEFRCAEGHAEAAVLGAGGSPDEGPRAQAGLAAASRGFVGIAMPAPVARAVSARAGEAARGANPLLLGTGLGGGGRGRGRQGIDVAFCAWR